MDTEERATTQVTTVSLNDCVTILQVVTQGQKSYLDLVFIKKEGKDGDVLEITQSTMKNVPEAGYISVARVIFYPSSSTGLFYDVQILFTSVQKGTVVDIDAALNVCHLVSTQRNHKFCPGLDEREYYDNYYSVIRYHLKSGQLWDKPFKRIDS